MDRFEAHRRNITRDPRSVADLLQEANGPGGWAEGMLNIPDAGLDSRGGALPSLDVFRVAVQIFGPISIGTAPDGYVKVIEASIGQESLRVVFDGDTVNGIVLAQRDRFRPERGTPMNTAQRRALSEACRREMQTDPHGALALAIREYQHLALYLGIE